MNMILANESSKTIGNLLTAAQKTLSNYGMVIVSIIGVAMVIVGVYQIAKNLISHGKGQTSWVTTICLLLIGGILAIVGGWSTIGGILNMGGNTVKEMAGGSADATGTVSDPFETNGDSGTK